MTEVGAPQGRHRAAPRSSPGPLRALLVGLGVLLVVGLAGLTATWLGDGSPTASVDPAPPPATSAEAAPSTEVSSSPPSGSSSAGPPPAAPSLPAGPGDVLPGGVLPGAPIPGPAAPLGAADGVVPTTLRVPDAGVDVALVRLGVQADGTIEVPSDPDDAGWLTASAVPGRTGPAVVAGHVDSASGAAVFSRLGELVAGDPVEVALSDGTTVGYTVTGSERYPKDAFPTDDVYGPAPASVLRLVTCGGRFDRDAGSYEDNLVVYAVPAA